MPQNLLRRLSQKPSSLFNNVRAFQYSFSTLHVSFLFQQETFRGVESAKWLLYETNHSPALTCNSLFSYSHQTFGRLLVEQLQP